jgi:hypothetical protein
MEARRAETPWRLGSRQPCSESHARTTLAHLSNGFHLQRLPEHHGPSDGDGGLHVDDDEPNLYGVQLPCGLALCANGLDAFLRCGSAVDRRANSGRLGPTLARMSRFPC